MTVRVLIVDDHPLFRKGVRDTLMLEPGLQVIGEASDGQTALDMIRRLNPHLVLMDVHLPGLNGLDVIRQARSHGFEGAILVLTAYDSEEQMRHAIRIGASGYCSKDTPPDRLLQNIRHVLSGRCILGWRVVSAAEAQQIVGVAEASEDHALSPREREILQYVALGYSNKAIAERLGISQQTVKNHMTAILRKLDLSDRTQAAILAIRRGWVRLPEEPIFPEEKP
ncbi:response regulator transcription factor [Thermoflexus sp.]|uniref:response regulator transcription factor n=1 Tax=Thermoflexus sp. TaxID=1969742 RepID=UPI002ADE44F5|nr:response regulator transcription factor [Thermoflexus sp.]